MKKKPKIDIFKYDYMDTHQFKKVINQVKDAMKKALVKDNINQKKETKGKSKSK